LERLVRAGILKKRSSQGLDLTRDNGNISDEKEPSDKKTAWRGDTGPLPKKDIDKGQPPVNRRIISTCWGTDNRRPNGSHSSARRREPARGKRTKNFAEK